MSDSDDFLSKSSWADRYNPQDCYNKHIDLACYAMQRYPVKAVIFCLQHRGIDNANAIVLYSIRLIRIIALIC